jgi:hypothetical protein
VVSNRARDLSGDREKHRPVKKLTGEQSLAAEVTGVEFPQLLAPVDDQPPATVVLATRRTGGQVIVQGVSHDNGEIASVVVNGQPAKIVSQAAGVADWEIALDLPADQTVSAHAFDRAGNVEQRKHQTFLTSTDTAAE